MGIELLFVGVESAAFDEEDLALHAELGEDFNEVGQSIRVNRLVSDLFGGAEKLVFVESSDLRPEAPNRAQIDASAVSNLQFTRRLGLWHDWCERHGLPRPDLQLRAMPKRWGSSLPSGKILLNPLLVRTPSICIDYVIAHEVCHLKEPHHNAAFFRLLGRMVPNWRAVKLRLEQAEL